MEDLSIAGLANKLKKQIQIYEEQIKSITDKIKTWRDAAKISKPLFYINNNALIAKSKHFYWDKNAVPSEKHAQSVLAMSQLMVIADAFNQQMGSNYISYQVLYNGKAFIVVESNVDYNYGPISFKSKISANHSITQFIDLWYDYYMIDTPYKK